MLKQLKKKKDAKYKTLDTNENRNTNNNNNIQSKFHLSIPILNQQTLSNIDYLSSHRMNTNPVVESQRELNEVNPKHHKSMSMHFNKLSDLEKSVMNNNVRIDEMNRNMENMINYNNEKSRVLSEEKRVNMSEMFESGFLKQENITLKADNLIFREDINHLTEVNKNQENELAYLRKKKYINC